MKEERAAPKSAKFAGMTFVFTGTLAKRSREEAEALVAAHGGKAGSSVSKKTSYVVVGADPGSKFEKAKSLDVPDPRRSAIRKAAHRRNSRGARQYSRNRAITFRPHALCKICCKTVE